jgi:DNA-binding NtrC family response regulator
MHELGSVLILGRSSSPAVEVAKALARRGHRVRMVERWAAAAAELDREAWDVVLATPSDVDPLVACRRVPGLRPTSAVVVVSDDRRLASAVSAIRARAADYVLSSEPAERVAAAVERVIATRALGDELERLRARSPRGGTSFPELIGESPTMRELKSRLERVRKSDATVLIVGESGTGKEIVARALHEHGPRSKGSFVAVSCAAISPGLVESEFFGHARGAFTDARGARDGLLVQASGGTLFLDEIASMPMALQAKLLRALQERTVRPIGRAAEVRFDARIIAAASVDLAEEARAGRFREDLFFRLSVLKVRLPRLKDRGFDVLLLAQHFLDHAAKLCSKRVRSLSPAAARALMAYQWPGNVRELSNCVQQAVALARFDHIVEDDLPEALRLRRPDTAERKAPLGSARLDTLERDHIASVLTAVGGNKARAARILGIDRTTLYRKIRQLEGPKDEHA